MTSLINEESKELTMALFAWV